MVEAPPAISVPASLQRKRIATYFAPLRGLTNATGVTKHALGVIGALAERSDVSLQLLANRRAYDAQRPNMNNVLRDQPVSFMHGNETLARRVQLLTEAFPVDERIKDVDWIYCARETPLATRNARLAITVHDVLMSEPEVSGL